jgi:hypothetical protein
MRQDSKYDFFGNAYRSGEGGGQNLVPPPVPVIPFARQPILKASCCLSNVVQKGCRL